MLFARKNYVQSMTTVVLSKDLKDDDGSMPLFAAQLYNVKMNSSVKLVD